jgi:hypothetical protein
MALPLFGPTNASAAVANGLVMAEWDWH